MDDDDIIALHGLLEELHGEDARCISCEVCGKEAEGGYLVSYDTFKIVWLCIKCLGNWKREDARHNN